MAKLYITQIPSFETLQRDTVLRSPELDHLSFYSHVLLRKIAADLDTNLEQFFNSYNLSAGRFTLLALLLQKNEGMMPSELAQKVGVTQATISGLINSLEKSQLVQRAHHEKDGRSYLIALTDSGRQKCLEILPLYHERIAKYWSSVADLEKHQLNGALEKLLTSIHKLGEA